MSTTMIVDRTALQERHAEALDLAALAAVLAENLHNRILDGEDGLDLSNVAAVADQLARRLGALSGAIEGMSYGNASLSTAA